MQDSTNKENSQEQLKTQVTLQAKRIQKAQREKHSVLVYASFLGVLGLVFVLPVVGGAYLGHWLDGFSKVYTIRWTLSLMFLGIIVGAMNVYFLMRGTD